MLIETTQDAKGRVERLKKKLKETYRLRCYQTVNMHIYKMP